MDILDRRSCRVCEFRGGPPVSDSLSNDALVVRKRVEVSNLKRAPVRMGAAHHDTPRIPRVGVIPNITSETTDTLNELVQGFPVLLTEPHSRPSRRCAVTHDVPHERGVLERNPLVCLRLDLGRDENGLSRPKVSEPDPSERVYGIPRVLFSVLSKRGARAHVRGPDGVMCIADDLAPAISGETVDGLLAVPVSPRLTRGGLAGLLVPSA